MRTAITIRAVGGVFTPVPGSPRSSGYFRKLIEALVVELGPMGNWLISNGGGMSELNEIITSEISKPSNVSIWMGDIPNTEEKKLPELSKVWRANGTYLVQSKNNDGSRYTNTQLWNRMLDSNAELLLEVKRGSGRVSGTLHTIAGKHTPETENILELALNMATAIKAGFGAPPLAVSKASITRDSLSYKNIEIGPETEIPLEPHPGAFGVSRKHHIHEGLDLYAQNNQPVMLIEAGKVIAIRPFTGPQLNMPWWNDTYCVMVEGPSGVINYGEIAPISTLEIGQEVCKGQLIGTVATVLKIDKGRPMSMLHLERYVHGTVEPVTKWSLTEPNPPQLLDPTGMVQRAYTL